jgi:hypothetical protein
MGPNDIELVNLFTRDPADTTTSDVTIPVVGIGEVVVEAEAGATAIGGGNAFTVDIVVRDLSAVAPMTPTIAATPNPPGSNVGILGGPNWPVTKQQFLFQIAAANMFGRTNHICQVVAYLNVATGGVPDVSFAESPLFMLI